MDDTQQRRISDAAATRKRRSSILKSQRPPRAPFSELEFNVTTPTDSAKSRRVSFSRRTGVAEFVTNEATTTWKNFYEEHNKTLESSGNESDLNAPRPFVGHLGRRIFEDQFQEVEIVDYRTNTDLTKIEYNNIDSITDDNKLPLPQQNFELSALTATGSKLFEDNFAISRLGEITDKINVDFSVMTPIGDDLDEIQKDIERHAKNSANVVCAGLSDRNLSEFIEVDLNATQGGIGTIDVALDDMSITDTISSPKVNVSKTNTIEPKDKTPDIDWVADKENIVVNPYIAPKETNNFAINEESDKVLVFDGKRLTIQSQNEPLSDYRKTLLPSSLPEKTPKRKTIVLNVDDDLPNFVLNPHVSMSLHSQNISLDNTIPEECDISVTQPIKTKIKTDETQISVCKNNSIHGSAAALSNGSAEKRDTIVLESDVVDISVTQPVPSGVILKLASSPTQEPEDKTKTIVFEDDSANISMTQALPINFFSSQNGQTVPVYRLTIMSETDEENIPVKQMLLRTSTSVKRNTIVFDEKEGNISLTQAISGNFIVPETNLSVNANELPPAFESVVNETDEENIPVNQMLLSTSRKRNTIVFSEKEGNVSLTQAIPGNLIIPETDRSEAEIKSAPAVASKKRKTIVFNEEEGNISLTQSIPGNLIILETDKTKTEIKSPPPILSTKRNTIVFNQNEGNISFTQAIPQNLVIPETDRSEAEIKSSAIAPKQRNTIVFNENEGNISLTQAITRKLIIPETGRSETEIKSPQAFASKKRNTIVFNKEEGDISFTQSIPGNLIIPETLETEINSPPAVASKKRKTILFNDEEGNISFTQSIPKNLITPDTNRTKTEIKLPSPVPSKKRNTIVFDEVEGNISLTQSIPGNLIIPETDRTKTEINSTPAVASKKRNTIVFNEEEGNISLTQAISGNLIVPETVRSQIEIKSPPRNTIVFAENEENISVTQAIPRNLIVLETNRPETKSPPIFVPEKGNTSVFNETEKNISLTQAIPENPIVPETDRAENEIKSPPASSAPKKRNTFGINETERNISPTQAIPENHIVPEKDWAETEIKSPPVSSAPEKINTLVFNENEGNKSLKQAIPEFLVIPKTDRLETEIKEPPASSASEKRNTIICNEKEENVSLTKAIPGNLIVPETDLSVTDINSPPIFALEKRNTIFNEKEENLIIPKLNLSNEEPILQKDAVPDKRISVYEPALMSESSKNEVKTDISITQALPTDTINPKITIFDDNDLFNMTVTRSMPLKPIVDNETKAQKTVFIDGGHISMTQTVSTTIDKSNKIKSDIKPGLADISVTQTFPGNLILPENKKKNYPTKVIKFEDNASMTAAIPSNILSAKQADAHFKSESETSASSSATIVEVNTKESYHTPASEQDSEVVIEKKENKFVMGISKKIVACAQKFTPNHKTASHPIPSSLISLQKTVDDLAMDIKHSPADGGHSSGFMVYQAAATNSLITRNQSEVPRKELSSVDSDTVGSSSLSSTEYRGRNKVTTVKESITSCSSGAIKDNYPTTLNSVSKKIETALNDDLNAIVEVSEPSISGDVDRSCSNMKLCDSPTIKLPNTNIRTGILDSLLDMNDSFMSNNLVNRSVSATVPETTNSAETMFIITRDDDGVQTKSDDEGNLVLKQDKSEPLHQREKVCGTVNSNQGNWRRSVADSTADLLDLISQFAEKGEQVVRAQENSERQRASVPKRQSIVLSREDLLNNISMAQAMLQTVSSRDSSMSELSSSSERLSPEVVKVLRFEDENDVPDSFDQVMVSPLKKTAFGESSYMVEEMKKNHVIPTYLKDVTDSMKAVMTDLLKPMSDELPFAVETKKKSNTRSKQVQTNMNSAAHENLESDAEGLSESLGKKLKGIIKKREYYERYDTESQNLSIVSSDKSVNRTWEEIPDNNDDCAAPTLVFDRDNPLNNVLIKPIDFGAAHRYNPALSPPSRSRDSSYTQEYRSEGLLVGRSNMVVATFKTGEDVTHKTNKKEKISTNNNARVIPNYETQNVDPNTKKSLTPESKVNKTSNENKIDVAVVTSTKKLRNQQVNTAIAMQENLFLLLRNSSLTLVESCSDKDYKPDDEGEYSHSPLKTIYKQAQDKINDDFSDAEDVKSEEKVFAKEIIKRKSENSADEIHDLCESSLDEAEEEPREAKLPRLSYSPPKVDNEEKIQPVENVKDTKNKNTKKSPTYSSKKSLDSHRGSVPLSTKKEKSPKHRPETDTKQKPDLLSKAASKEKRDSSVVKKEILSPRSPKKHKQAVEKPNTNVLVQFSMLNSDRHGPREDLSRNVSCTGSDDNGFLFSRPSDTSGSKGDDNSESNELLNDRSYPLDWQPELINELSSKNLVTERENDIDVCEIILDLPFMGECDCKWELCSLEEWHFLLVHGRLRLVVGLSRSPGSDPRNVRSDTPVTGLRLESTVTEKKKGSAGGLCVRFAADAMRYLAARGCARAGDVPALLRRCAGVSRVALRWGRAMHHTWTHLAYSLTDTGSLTLTVANFPLRSVWEVTMNIEMTVSNARDVPWPRATNVRVLSVVNSTRLEQTEVQRALRRVKEDWGHVPRTLWKIFRYLKKNTQNINAIA